MSHEPLKKKLDEIDNNTQKLQKKVKVTSPVAVFYSPLNESNRAKLDRDESHLRNIQSHPAYPEFEEKNAEKINNIEKRIDNTKTWINNIEQLSSNVVQPLIRTTIKNALTGSNDSPSPSGGSQGSLRHPEAFKPFENR